MASVSALALTKEDEHRAGSDVIRMQVSDLRIRFQYRDRGINSDHVATLAALEGEWPPILVARDGSVVDGAHRVHAARVIGLSRMPCILFDGTPKDAYLEFVRRNTRHGLPLTLRERQRAAAELLSSHRDWSDRLIAQHCGLSPRTVASLRRSGPAVERLTAQNAQWDSRVGRDGRTRTSDPKIVTQRVTDAIGNDPNGSLRAIAKVAQVSPETVRRVKMRLGLADPGHPGSIGAELATANGASLTLLNGRDRARWEADAALRSMEDGNAFLAWFEGTKVCHEWRQYISSVPTSRVYEIADEARCRATSWRDFADALEARISGRRSGT